MQRTGKCRASLLPLLYGEGDVAPNVRQCVGGEAVVGDPMQYFLLIHAMIVANVKQDLY
jgi:hypothetical protein